MRMRKLAANEVKVGNGRKQLKASLLKLHYLQNIAEWSCGDAAALDPSIATVFSRCFAALGEAIGVIPDDSLFICERCETILRLGDNCTVRIEKNKSRKCPKHKGSKVPTQNKVVYKCHFCSQQIVKRGTLKGHMKRICPPKVKPIQQPGVRFFKPVKSSCSKELLSTPKTLENLVTSTSSAKPDITSPTTSSKKRKKRTWTGLKAMVKISENRSSKNFSEITVPFFL